MINQNLIRENYPKVFARMQQFWPVFQSKNGITIQFSELTEEMKTFFMLSFLRHYNLNVKYDNPVSAHLTMLNEIRIKKELELMENTLLLEPSNVPAMKKFKILKHGKKIGEEFGRTTYEAIDRFCNYNDFKGKRKSLTAK